MPEILKTTVDAQRWLENQMLYVKAQMSFVDRLTAEAPDASPEVSIEDVSDERAAELLRDACQQHGIPPTALLKWNEAIDERRVYANKAADLLGLTTAGRKQLFRALWIE
jgi:hypothetical protein